jgi:hypothetical protein
MTMAKEVKPSTAQTTALHTMAVRDAIRAENDGGFLVKPPMPVERLANAQFLDGQPGAGSPRPNQEMAAMLQWLDSIFDAGGNEADLRKAWDAWKPNSASARTNKIPARSKYDALMRRAGEREAALIRQADWELKPLQNQKFKAHNLEAARRELQYAMNDLERVAGETSGAAVAIAASAREQVKMWEATIAQLHKRSG